MKKIKPFLIVPVLLAIGVLTAIAGSRAGWFAPDRLVELPEPEQEFRQLCNRYLQQDSLLNLSGNILLYDGENARQVKEQSSFLLVKQGKTFYTRLGHLQTYGDGEWMVQLDTINRIMVVAGAGDGKVPGMPALQQSINGLFSDTAAFRIRGKVSGDDQERTLSFSSDFNPEVREYRITYDAKSYQLKKTVIEWWKDAVVLDTTAAERVWVTEIGYQYNMPRNLRDGEKLQELVTIKGREALPLSNYKDYQVHIAFNQDK